jgi:lipopolysaccharide export system protein LptC
MPGEIRKAQEFASAQFSFRARQFGVVARATLRGAHRYSLFVRIMKGALPLSAIGLVILVLAYILQPTPARIQMSFQRVSKLANDLAMDNPRLSGTDNDGQPFVVYARSATPQAGAPDHISLQAIVADFSLKDGTAIHLTAGNGIMNTTTHLLQMGGGVQMAAQNGYEAAADSAMADLRAGTIHGEKGISANGAFGRITSQRFAMNRTSRQLHFWGNVHMLLNPGSLSGQRQGKAQ